MGLGLAATSLLLFVVPSVVAAYWPWKITPLTARVIAAELGLFSFFALEVAVVARWSEVRSLLLPQLISPLVFVFAIVASWDDFDKSKSLTWAFVVFVVMAFVVGFPAMYFPLEARRKLALFRDPLNESRPV